MEAEWNLLKESSSMTNVTIICSDGIIHTHKIVVASASDFFKYLLSEIPVGDKISIFLPDYVKCSIIDLLNGVFLAKNSGNFNDIAEFGCTSIFEPVPIKVMVILVQGKQTSVLHQFRLLALYIQMILVLSLFSYVLDFA